MEERSINMDTKTSSEASPTITPGGFDKFIIYFSKIIDPVCEYGALFAGIMLAAMMFLTFFDVGGRNLVNKPIIGSYEITEFMMVLLVAFGLSFCARHKGHIRVDVILAYASRKTTRWFNIIAYAFSLIFYILITWQGWLNAWSNLSGKSVSTILLVPIYPFAFLLVIGAALTALVFLRDFLKSINEVIK
jgi:TRAP-type transport system small permease protein